MDKDKSTTEPELHSPELLLSPLNRRLRELRAAAGVLESKEMDEELLPIMRRLLLAEIVGNTWIVAIGGSQGVGKTTLVRTMYGLESGEHSWLRGNQGLGENLPAQHIPILK